MWVFVGLAGCMPTEDSHDPVGPHLVIEPAAVDFGGVRFGEAGTASVTLSNDGDVAMAFDGMVAPEDLVVDDLGPFELEPGDEELRTVSWTPSTIYGIHDAVTLVTGGAAAARIPVTGSVLWGALEVSLDHVNFVDVNIGCETSADLTVRNDGTGDEALTAISVSDPAFAVTSSDGEPLDLPLTLAAGSEEVVRVHFAPDAAKPATGTMVLDSASMPAVAVVNLYGEGRPLEPDTKTWTVEHDEAVTGIINVNDALMDPKYEHILGDRVREFLAAFLGSLLDAPEPFRVAIVMDEDGGVHGPLPYIDASFTLDEAVVAAEVMLEGRSKYDDNDRGLETCLRGIDANEDWLIEDGAEWSESNLNLVVINVDVEQSPYDASYYVDRYLEHKSAKDLAVHAIAGDMPAGCTPVSKRKYAAEASPNLYDATVATGGVYLSVCAPDWTEWGRTLAWRFTAPYVLDGAPSLSSIEVFVDGDTVSSGWSYDDVTHELAFDDPSEPAEGAELRVDYARCD